MGDGDANTRIDTRMGSRLSLHDRADGSGLPVHVDVDLRVRLHRQSARYGQQEEGRSDIPVPDARYLHSRHGGFVRLRFLVSRTGKGSGLLELPDSASGPMDQIERGKMGKKRPSFVCVQCGDFVTKLSTCRACGRSALCRSCIRVCLCKTALPLSANR